MNSLLPVNPVAPDHIQFLPPGLVTGQVGGKDGPRNFSASVDESLCDKLARQVRFHRQCAALRGGLLPRITFDHDDRRMAGEVMELFWGGDSAHDGGIRARIRWTDEGRRAVEAREWTRFSPCFMEDANQRLVGVSSYLGSLTNRPGILAIAPILPMQLEAGEAEMVLDPSDPKDVEIFRIAIS
jgi:hypothetical protein